MNAQMLIKACFLFVCFNYYYFYSSICNRQGVTTYHFLHQPLGKLFLGTLCLSPPFELPAILFRQVYINYVPENGLTVSFTEENICLKWRLLHKYDINL